MPVTTSATKALRRDRHRTTTNRRTRSQLKSALDAVKRDPNPKNVQAAYRVIDRAAKKHIIHKNKASRLKAQCAKRLSLSKVPAKKPVLKKKTVTSKKK